MLLVPELTLLLPPKPLELEPKPLPELPLLLPKPLLPIPNELPFMLPSAAAAAERILAGRGGEGRGPAAAAEQAIERGEHFGSRRIFEVINVDARVLIGRADIQPGNQILDLPHFKLAREDDDRVGPFVRDDAEGGACRGRLRAEARTGLRAMSGRLRARS